MDGRPRTAITLSLLRYLLAAALIRCAQGGAAVGLVSLTLSRDPSGGAILGGVLAALLTAPHVTGPWLARVLTRAGDGRLVLAGSFAMFGIGLSGAALLLGHVPPALVAVPVVLAGLSDPLATGGLSSRLAGIVGGDDRTRRRAEGWDAATYGLANILGPAAVGAVAALASPLVAVLVLGAGGVLAAGLVATLPMRVSAVEKAAVTVREALRLLVRIGPLRRVMVATMLQAVSMGGVMVVAVVFGRQLSGTAGAGATIAAAYGVGNLIGSVTVALFPLRGEPERLTIALIGCNAAAVALCAAAPVYVVALGTFALAGATSAMLFTASLAVRSVYSPLRARAQVFVSMAGVKMAAASGGTALAGVLAGVSPRVALLVGGAVTVLAVLVALFDRRLTGAPAQPAEQAADSTVVEA